MMALSTALFLVMVAAVSPSEPATPAAPKLAASPKTEAWAKAWMRDLHEMGLRIEGDSMHVSRSAQRVLSDADYRKAVYPETYRWEMVQALIDAKQIKIALWHLINLYEAGGKYRDPALRMFLALDGPLEMDRVLLSTFYTYGLLDPRVCTVNEGHPEVTRPDLAEKRLGVVKEIVQKIAIHRKTKSSPPADAVGGARRGGGR